MFIKISSVCSVLIISAFAAKAQVAPEPQELTPGNPVQREIAGGGSHTYKINLAAGQFVRFRLTQRAIDEALSLTAPAGKQLAEMDVTGAGEEESLSFEAATAGSYQLIIRGKGQAELRGSYGLEATLKTSPTAQDRKREAAELLLVEENKLLVQGNTTAQQRIEKLDQALPLWLELEDNYWAAITIKKIGINYYYLKQYEKAADYYEQALSIFREGKNRADEGDVLSRMSLTASGLHQYEKAVEYGEQSLLIARELKDRTREAVMLSNIAVSYDSLGLSDKCITYNEQSLAVYRELKDRRGEGKVIGNLGYTYGQMGNIEKAIEFNEQALTIARETKYRVIEMYKLKDLGDNFSELGREDKAVEYYEQALTLSRESKDTTVDPDATRNLEVGAILALGQSYENLGRSEKAIEYFEQGLAICREAKIRRGEVYALENLGAIYGDLGRNEKAIEYFEQALAVAREVNSRDGQARTLRSLGFAYRRQKNYEKAVEFYEQALLIYRDLKSRPNEAITLSQLGSVYALLGQGEKAIEYSEKAVAIFRETKSRYLEGRTLDRLGVIYGRLNRPDKAIEYHQQALAISREVVDRNLEADALYGLASAESSRGNLTASRVYIEQSIAIVESLRSNEISSPELRSSFLATFQDSYKLYTDVLMRRHKDEPTKGFDALAFESSEFERARSLLDLLAEAHANIRQGVDATLLERERTIGKKLSSKAEDLTRANPESVDALKKEISQLETDYERAQTAIRKASPHYAELVQPQPVKLSEIQAELDAETVLLEYSLGAAGQDRSYLWAITRDTLTSYELPKAAVIEKSAREVYEFLTARSTNKPGETSIQRQDRISQAEAKLPDAALALSKTILAPVAAKLGSNRLIIVADGALQYIPFAMLPDPAYDNSQPLVIGHEVVSLPSASTLVFQRTELAGRQPAPKTLAVIADPVFDRTDVRFKTLVAAPDAKAQTGLPADARGLEHIATPSATEKGRLVIRRLPFTRQEADAIISLAPKNSTSKAIDFEANRTNVLSGDLAQYRYVHFATHGVMDTERPGLSSLVLSTIDADGKPQNGFLRANDIYNMKLPAELVVLSACQTGLGKEVKGEGLIGLTRGFMYAGAKRVVVSLWSVNDKATSDLMTNFYRGMLKNNERPAAALRAAQIEMWKQKKWQSPYYWAAFTMQGEWR